MQAHTHLKNNNKNKFDNDLDLFTLVTPYFKKSISCLESKENVYLETKIDNWLKEKGVTAAALGDQKLQKKQQSFLISLAKQSFSLRENKTSNNTPYSKKASFNLANNPLLSKRPSFVLNPEI